MREDLIALIDLGSNSIQLAIYNIDNTGNHYYEVNRVKVTARLINYLNKQGNVTNEGIDLILTALMDFQKVCRTYGVSRAIGFATAVIRNSSNQNEVLTKIYRKTKFSFSVLSEYEEAYYGYLGVIQSTDLQDGITIDIGGGSTELTLFRKRKMIQYHSFPFGAVNLNESFTKGKKVTNQQVVRLRNYLLTQFDSLSWLDKAGLPIIGIGGSAKNLSRIYQSKSTTKQLNLTLSEIKGLFTELSSLDVDERSKIRGLSKKRKDIIIPAVQTVSLLMEVVQSPYFVYCEKTVRDGVIFAHLQNTSNTHLSRD